LEESHGAIKEGLECPASAAPGRRILELRRMSTHKQISFAKSFIRIFGYFALALAFGNNATGFVAAMILIASKILGIVEEVGEK